LSVSYELKKEKIKRYTMKKIKLGLVGCGAMMAAHLSGIELVESVEITAICDTDQENLQAVKEFLEGIGQHPFVTTDWKTMPDYIDAVMIALPHDLHFECGMFFAYHNKHLLMEKPLCNTEEECVRLIEECESRNLKFMCAYPVRFWPTVVKLKEFLDTGDYGEIMQMSIWTEQYTKYEQKDGGPHWVNTARVGGGQLFSHGCHYIDVLLWFLGNPLYGTHIGTRNGTPWMLKEGTSVVTMKFENGAIAYHGATWGARGTRLGTCFQVQTERGMLEYVSGVREIRFYHENGLHKPGEYSANHAYDVLWKGERNNTKETQHEIKHFVECILEDKTPRTNARQSLQSLRVIWALYNAEANNAIADLRGLGIENA
jgi:predicted dehydrogenase